jgi:ribosomal protein S15P/S13E
MTNANLLKGKVRKQMAAGWNEAIGATNVQAYMITTDIEHLFPHIQEAGKDVQEVA